jgi:hypothetical protein
MNKLKTWSLLFVVLCFHCLIPFSFSFWIMKMIERRGYNALLVGYWRRMALSQQRYRSSVFSADTMMIDDVVVDDDNHHHLQNIAIVGGGLAGLSTAYHLLQKNPSLGITILDTSLPGEGGASTVAGG